MTTLTREQIEARIELNEIGIAYTKAECGDDWECEMKEHRLIVAAKEAADMAKNMTNTELRDLLEEARKALEPFSKDAAQYDEEYEGTAIRDDWSARESSFDVGQIRQARTTYDKLKAALEPDKDKP